jgi:hypothetical protein
MEFIGNCIWVWLIACVVGGCIWRFANKESHERFKNEAPGAFLTWLSRHLK